jgi:4,5-DOPA dioxygenase extradiol
VLAHVYPEADVPVVQLSINALRPLDYHLALASALAPLRQRGVMILGSGNVVHNLKRVQWNQPDFAFDWAERFDDVVVEQLSTAPGDILKVMEHPDYDLAVPTPDHFIPLLYLAGLAAADGVIAEPLVRGYSMGSISMTCYGTGLTAGAPVEADGGAGVPRGIPTDQTNM